MLDRHNLSFPVRRYETATSYVSRFTRYCGLASPNDFCLDRGFRWQDIVRGDDDLFEKLARFGGASTVDLKRWAVRTTSRHQFEVSGQQATKASLVRTRLRVCPHCLVSDRQKWGVHGVFRRHLWQFLSIRNCIEHGTPLISLPSEEYTIHNYDFVGKVDRHWRLIKRSLNEPNNQGATKFERYLSGRLDGLPQNAFLDGMPMFIASRLCEILGLVLLFGPKQKISKTSESAFALAGQAGFDALQNGEDGLYEALDSLVTPMAFRTVRHQSDMGAFFEWLTLASMGPELEPIKDKVRAYLFRTYPFAKGDMVLGKPCRSASTFTIHRAWQTLGIQRNRMNRFLIEEGFAERDEQDACVRLKEGLSAKDLESISQKLANRLTSREAKEILNASAEMLQLLRDDGILVPMTDGLDRIPKYQKNEIDQLLSKLSGCVSAKAGDSKCMVSIVEASCRVRCPGSTIVGLILKGRLQTVWKDDQLVGLAAFKVNLSELRRALPPIEMQGVTKGQACQMLRVTYRTINYLIEKRLLTSKRVRNPNSRQFLQAVCSDSIDLFQRKYVTLGQLAHRYKRSSGPLGCHLEAKGVCPCETAKGISWYYERKGLQQRLTRAGLVLPEG